MEFPSLDAFLAFQAFCESRNMTEAARRLGISQPALSKQLSALERAFEQPLFAIHGRKKRATPFGDAVLAEVRASVGAFPERLRRIHDAHAYPESQRLRVGARRELIAYLVPRVSFPGTIHFVDLSAREAVESLLRGEVDLAVSNQRPDTVRIKCRKLFSNGSTLISHPKWLAGAKPESLDIRNERGRRFLESVPFLAYRENDEAIARVLDAAGIPARQARIKVIYDDWRLLRDLVERGEGACVIPDRYLEGVRNLVQIPVPESIVPSRSFYLLYEPTFTRRLKQARILFR